jgi:hypothetical protein
VTQPDPRAQIEHVIGRNPRLRQPLDHQQLAQMPSVRAVALGALLVPAPRARLGRLGEMHARMDRVQLLHHEAPTRRRLQRDLQLTAAKAPQEATHSLTVRRSDAGARDLARPRIEPLRGDLRSMLIKSHYDRHTGPPQAPRSNTCADYPRLS